MKIIPHTGEGRIPLYPFERILTLQNISDWQIGQDTIHALEQEQKFYVRVFDFENAGQMKEANVEIRDNQDSVWFSGNTTNGIIETTYIPTGGEGDGFEGVVNVTPLDNSYFGTRMVVTGGDMTGPNQQELVNNLGIPYHGYEYTVPAIQSNFDKTDTISFYLLSRTREDPLHPGEMLTMNRDEISEMEGNSINTEMVRYDAENMFFRDTRTSDYDDYRNHARLIFGYAFGENEVSTERSSSAIDDYSIDNDNYKTTLGWNVSFGYNSTGIIGVNPDLFGKANINSRGEVYYDFTNQAGCAREDARRIGIATVTSRISYMNASSPPNFPDTLNQKDRVYTNLFLYYRKTQLKQDRGVRNMTNLGYLFVPAKQKNAGIKP